MQNRKKTKKAFAQKYFESKVTFQGSMCAATGGWPGSYCGSGAYLGSFCDEFQCAGDCQGPILQNSFRPNYHPQILDKFPPQNNRYVYIYQSAIKNKLGIFQSNKDLNTNLHLTKVGYMGK
jgi:hypothetical protein